MNTKLKQRRKFIKLASGLMVTPFASLVGGAASAQAGTSPLRLLTVIESYGLPDGRGRGDIWINSTAGDYALNPDQLGTTLAPFRAYTDNMLVCTGNNMVSLSETGNSRIHDFMATHTLTGSSRTSGNSASAKGDHASLDFHIGQYLNSQVGLNLGRPFSHLFFTNYSSPNDTTFCYDASGNQIRSLAGPLNQATAVFGNSGSGNAAGIQLQNDMQLSIFELVQSQVQSLRGQLNNASDSTVIDAYQSSVNDLAAQIEARNEDVSGQCEIPGNIPDNLGVRGQSTESTPLIFRNIQQAFACDLTSSLTYAIGGETINQLNHRDLYDEEAHADFDGVLGLLRSNQHQMSHNTTDIADKAHEIVRIHQAEEVAALLDTLSTTPDVDGNTLLDNTVVFFTSAMATNTHSDDNYCQLIIAGKNTNLRGGFHYDLTDFSNNQLLTTIAQGMGLSDDRFGGINRNGNFLNSIPNGPISKMLLS